MSTQPTTQKTITTTGWLLLFMMACIWGGSFLSNHIALKEVGVLTTVAIRVSGASVALWIWVLLRGLPVEFSPRLIGFFLLLGLLNNAVPFSLIVWGQQYIESGLASILNASTAIFTVLLVSIVFVDEKLTSRRLVGVLLGFLGVSTAIGLSALTHFDLTSMGQIAILGSSTSYAVSGAIARVAFKGLRPEVSAAGMLTGAACVMIPFALMVEGLPQHGFHPATYGALAYLALCASAIAYILYYKVMEIAGAGNVSLVTLMVAPVAIVLGALFANEALPIRAYVGFGLLAIGLLIIDGRIVATLRRKFL